MTKNRYKASMKYRRWAYFPTLEEARIYADQVLKKTGTFIAIEEIK